MPHIDQLEREYLSACLDRRKLEYHALDKRAFKGGTDTAEAGDGASTEP